MWIANIIDKKITNGTLVVTVQYSKDQEFFKEDYQSKDPSADFPANYITQRLTQLKKVEDAYPTVELEQFTNPDPVPPSVPTPPTPEEIAEDQKRAEFNLKVGQLKDKMEISRLGVATDVELSIPALQIDLHLLATELGII